MKINWKILGNSPGYRAQKLAYINELKKDRHGNKNYIHRRFRWIIRRAIYYSKHTRINIDQILLEWEIKRTYSWNNYYQDHTFPHKYTKRNTKPEGIRGSKNKFKRRYSGYPAHKASMHYRLYLVKLSQINTTREGKKARWTMERKKREKRMRAYKLEQGL